MAFGFLSSSEKRLFFFFLVLHVFDFDDLVCFG